MLSACFSLAFRTLVACCSRAVRLLWACFAFAVRLLSACLPVALNLLLASFSLAFFVACLPLALRLLTRRLRGFCLLAIRLLFADTSFDFRLLVACCWFACYSLACSCPRSRETAGKRAQRKWMLPENTPNCSEHGPPNVDQRSPKMGNTVSSSIQQRNWILLKSAPH